MAKLFVSYSRKDSVVARRLIEAFRSIEQDVWVDWEAILPATDWLEQISRGIEEADAFIFLVSPDSIASEVCKVEVHQAAKNNKRIIPIVLRDVHPKDTPETISKLNWTFMRETDNFEEGLAKVKTAIQLDLDWLEEHRRLQVRALEWHRKKDPSLLLHGRDLRNARRMVETATSKDPIPTDLQKTYILHSSRTERNRTFAWIATGITVISLTLLSFLATEARDRAVTAQTAEAQQRQTAVAALTEEAKQRQTAVAALTEEAKQRQTAVAAQGVAEQRETEAEAQRSAARAQIYLNRPGELYTSTLLAIDSLRRDSSDEAEDILRRNISLLPVPVEQFAQAGKINALLLNRKDNSDTFVTASGDGTVCGWSIDENRINDLFCTPEDQPAVNAVAFSPDGSFLVAGNQAGLVQVLHSETGEVLHAFDRVEPSGQVQIMEVEDGRLPDGYTSRGQPVRSINVRPTRPLLIVVAYADGEIVIFDPNTGKINSRLSMVNRPNVTGLSPRGSWLVAGSEHGQVFVWNLADRSRFPLSTHRGGVLALDFSTNTTNIVTAGGDSIAVSNLSAAKEFYRIPVQSPIRDVAFNSDSSWFVSGSNDHRIRVWETDTADELLAMSQDGVVVDVVISSNDRWIASTGDDQTARVWDAKTGAEIFQIPLQDKGSRLAFCNNDKWLISTDESGAIAIWDISKVVQPALSISSDAVLSHVQYSPSGKWLAAASQDQVWILTPDPESILRDDSLGIPIYDSDSNVRKLAFSPDSALLGILAEGNELVIYNVEERKPQKVQASERIQSIAFTPDSQQLITSDLNGNLQAWNVTTGELLSGDDVFLQGTSLASAGNVVAVGSPNKISILNGNGNGAPSSIEFSGDNALLVFNADGSLLASSSSNGKTSIFQYQDGELTPLSSFAKGQVASLAFNPNGTLLAVGTVRNVYLIDVNTGKEVARIPNLSTVNGVSFSLDGKHLATASSRSLEFWEMSDIRQIKSDELIAAACSYLYEDFNDAQWAQFFGNETKEPLCKELTP
ncbi:MAG TPA: TIR domain-containing protein [Anaerolineales bacterium]|nr:TIR domain-containing protein [Anaerolineales bacterium]